MTSRVVGFICALVFAGSLAAGSAQRQAELDATCEAARERLLAPMRAYYVEQCIHERRRASREIRGQCERFYADFGAQTGNRAPLFYDLPECVYAFEYRRRNARR